MKDKLRMSLNMKILNQPKYGQYRAKSPLKRPFSY